MAMTLQGRERRKLRIRNKISGTDERPRLSVFRSAKHIYAQVVDDASGITLASASTLSRDIKELGLVKRAADGSYQAAPEDDPSAPASDQARHTLQRALVDYLAGIQQSQQLLVLRTGAGEAQPLALAIDKARLADVLGTIAGDDTILVITRDARAARTLLLQFEGLAAS